MLMPELSVAFLIPAIVVDFVRIILDYQPI